MQMAHVFLPTAFIALVGSWGGIPPTEPDVLPANMAFAVSVADPIQPATASDSSPDGKAKNSLRVRRNSQGDRLFYVSALVNGKPVRFLVDTGSSLVILTEADARQAGVDDLGSPALHVETASGASAMRAANLKRVDLAGQVIHNVDGAIVDGNLKVSLLGQSVLSKLRSVRFAGNRLELN